MFQIRERKIIIIAVLALVVAVVTFGLLGSTGIFKNSLYDLGGAIVGFVVTAVLLNKFYGKDQGEIPVYGAAFLSEDTVKVLDMRSHKPMPPENWLTTPTNRVLLEEHYKLRKLADESVMKFPYATNGYGMNGSCVSHGAPLVDKTDEVAESGEDKHLRKQYEIELDVRGVAKNEIICVHHAVTYINAFEGATEEWFHTHVNVPTRSLTIILLFPKAQPCLKVTGTEKIGKSKAREVDRERLPIRVEGGDFVYWRIPNPLTGAGYKLSWEWQNSPVAPAPADV